MAERDWVAVVDAGACDECGFAGVDRAALATQLRAEAGRWASLLGALGDPDPLRRRPAPEVWSPLECAAHVRDVLDVFDGRVHRVLLEDGPELGWWDHEAAVVEQRYNDDDPAAVASAIEAGAARLAASLASVSGPAWERAGTRRGGERFTVEALGRFALHEARHHRHDAGGA